MTLLRLEWLRMLRTRRWIVLFGIFLFFGLIGPLTARYLAEIIQRFGGVEVPLPDPVPADGITQYSSNALQIGLLAVVVIAAQALGLDNRPEVAAFFRTRVESTTRLLFPRVAVVGVTAVAAFAAGTAAAWYETVVLIGSLPVGRLWLGAALGAIYILFVVVLTAAITTATNSALSTTLLVIGVLLFLPVLGLVPSIGQWLPSALPGAIDGLVRDRLPSEFAQATAVAVVTVALLWWVAVRRFARREV